ncbi:MAG: chemoreceptor glutamine deamidase CheD [Chromatiaceae bacterium]|nr:chemoreceptor glutamine deamidase CheD [Chromatiaceae bacterium]
MADSSTAFNVNSYFDPYFSMQAVKILPGEFFATTNNTLIVTVLGSCVAVCLRDKKNRVAGMNHFMLPVDNNPGVGWLGDSARYGIFAMEKLINEMMKLGAERHRLEAKVFGGGHVLKGLVVNDVGTQNAVFVLDYLKTERIPVLAKDLLEDYPRKVYFFPQSGKVLIKKIRVLNNTTILDRESSYRSKLREVVRQTDVDLFEES